MSIQPFHILSSPEFADGDLMILAAKNQFHLPKREMEKQAISTLLGYKNIPASWLTYLPSGKPFLTNQTKHISISHSHGFYGIIVSEFRCGLDIEVISEKAKRVRHKFLSEAEILFANNDEDYTRMWAVKEAVYKCFSEKALNFIEQINIVGFTKLFAEVKINGKQKSIYCRVYLSTIENLVTAYLTHPDNDT